SLLLFLMPMVSEANSPYGQKVANLALELVGTPYAFGGTSTSGFDASGLLVYAYGVYGAALPRTVNDHFQLGTSVTRANLRPGDIVLFSASGARWTSIFVGNNEVVWASSSSKNVRKASLNDSAVSANYVGARRLPDVVFAPLGKLIAAEAVRFLGARYEFGATGPTRFDASGLMQYLHSQFGVSIPRTMAQQYSSGHSVSRAQLQEGDIVFFGTSSSVSIVGLYLGNDEFVFASQSLNGVVKRSLSSYNSTYLAAKRYFGDAPPAPTPPKPPAPPVEVPKPDLASQIITTAEKYLGAPYVFGAVGPTTFDCSGFTRFVYAQHNISIPRTSLNQSQAGTLVANNDMQKGDILIFVDTYKAGISHVGIYIDEGKFIHATTSAGVSYSNLSQSYWSTRLHSVRRVIK
ncbi:MAG: C40 family peptidase, partial [Bacillota bacterium]|nr:C40 family peptidase [Bacillota bacterium]